jgi:zinc protease
VNYKYETYPNDPYGLRVYTLGNGLRVYLSKAKDEPRIKTRIVVRAGASSDPDDATGLAHYVEHMMFKGTDLIGALNREKEASLISKIKNKYEELYLAETSEIVNTINRDIDTLSRAASLEAVPGELDKLYSIMGCRNTNARTGFEETVYENDIPTVEFERWVNLEKERFSSPVLGSFPRN